MYYLGTRPHTTLRKTFLEAANEFMIHIAFMMMMLFTNFISDPETKFNLGYILVYVFLGVLVLNIIFMIHNGFNKFKSKKRKERIQKAYEVRFKSF
jgi:uncharacterized membrane protein